ncbi:Wall-associated receptor kinase galacturonan-binding domain-containing protein [Dioscorea alata]|uniref:Wall-associated receptor kinase galacturonan-binding domain-containing protein n=1 Tax=Dioscorea alata TaxID=55571 RepID=A0ACB7W5N6_DIOAL|nr:Wall-associated receptor kinase galacturonan-binding domain-containing protein [Dioscorea alata]
MIPTLSLLLAFLTFQIWIEPVTSDVPVSLCRSFCGNLTIDYPFALRPGCGHPGFRDLLFCINGMLMLHIASGSYRVLDIDYAYKGLILHDPGMSDCYSLIRTASGSGNGFIVEPWRAPYLEPAPDNVFMLLGCRAESPLFQGFPGRHLPCRNVSGMGCDEYYACPAWDFKPRGRESVYGLESPPPCCSVPFGVVRAINLSHLGCEGYSSAYSLAPLRPEGPGIWSYGIRVSYSVPADHSDFCRACQATGGLCGFDAATQGNMCLCEGWNSTSNCDSGKSLGMSMEQALSPAILFGGLLISIIMQIFSPV